MPDIVSLTDEAPQEARWRFRGSLSLRILAINILALALIAGSIFYLDGFRTRLIAERRSQQEAEIALIAAALASSPRSSRAAIIGALGQQIRDRIRAYDNNGELLLDSWELGPRTFRFDEPTTEGWDERLGRWLDAASDRIVGATIPPQFVDKGDADADAWSELAAVTSGESGIESRVRLAPDRSYVLTGAIKVPIKSPIYLLTVENAKDVTELVRAERFRLFQIVSAALAISIALSLYLARTIVAPLQTLARAAMRVRLGRAREVVIPRLPQRNDEIGVLSRALSDMTERLRQRIDATEAFAADVAHEIKNPLASLSSAVESLSRVEDPALKTQLLGIIGGDVRRMDRLITDISELSRLDGQLSRSRFEPIDLRALLDALISERLRREPVLRARLSLAGSARPIAGDPQRLARVFDNLIENALSFSPADSAVTVTLADDNDDVMVAVEDQGQGIPPEAREAIFRRFHSDRPDADGFGQHSGLGLAIARTIVEAHGGSIHAVEPLSGRGARLVVCLPVQGQSPN